MAFMRAKGLVDKYLRVVQLNCFFNAVMCLTDADGMASSVDPD